MRFLAFLIFFYSLSSQAAGRADCTDVDIRDAHPELKNFFSRPRNQESVGWCYGFVAADLLSIELGEPVSAFHTSAIYNSTLAQNPILRLVGARSPEGSFKKTREGGQIDDALRFAIQRGQICPESGMPYSSGGFEETFELLKFLEAEKEKIKKSKPNHERLCQDMRGAFPVLKFGSVEVEELLDILSKNNVNVALEKISQNICMNRLLKIPKLEVVNFKKRKSAKNSLDFFKSLNSALDQGKPVGIAYEVGHVSFSTGAHASLVLGRKWMNGKCSYRVRNSWGYNANSYKTETIVDRSDFSYWVDEDTLHKMTYRLTYIAPMKP